MVSAASAVAGDVYESFRCRRPARVSTNHPRFDLGASRGEKLLARRAFEDDHGMAAERLGGFGIEQEASS